MLEVIPYINQSFDFSSLLSITGIFHSVVVAEEFIFRGFFFQRLIGSVGIVGVQLIIAGYFLLKTSKQSWDERKDKSFCN